MAVTPRAATGKSLKVPEKAKAGTVKVAVAARSWEKLGDPITVHYFPPAKRPVALISPTPSGRLDPGDQVRVTFAGKAAAAEDQRRRALEASQRPHVRLHALGLGAVARQHRQAHAAAHRPPWATAPGAT